MPAAATVSWQLRTRSMSRSIGFSLSTAMPLAAAASISWTCVGVGEQITTASSDASAKTSAVEPVGRAPYCMATSSAVSVTGSATQVRLIPGWAAMFEACTLPMRPDPHKAAFSFFMTVPVVSQALCEAALGGGLQITKQGIRFGVFPEAPPDQLSLRFRGDPSHRLVAVKVSGEAVAFG